MTDIRANPQVTETLAGLRNVLSEGLVGAYLFGSAAMSTLRPNSDLDLMAVAARPTSSEEKSSLINRLLSISGAPNRPVELTIVVASEVKPWRYPPRMDFQFGDWWRSEFERGELEPWGTPVNPDLASLIRMVLISNTPLLGPSPAELFDPVPRDDYVNASLAGIDDLLNDLEWDTCNVVLTLVRIWSTLATDELRSKDAAAEWALRLLPSEHHRALVGARDIYLGFREPWAEGRLDEAHALATRVVREIRALENRLGLP
jgi:predicted nucleotidyltransferase